MVAAGGRHEEWIELPNDEVEMMELGWQAGSSHAAAGQWDSLVQPLKGSKSPGPTNRRTKAARKVTGAEEVVWPCVNDRVEVKKNLGELGWQWCHGRCLKVDHTKSIFQVRVSHDVVYRKRVIVAKGDEAWYKIQLGWRFEACDPDNKMAPVWPKHGRYMSMSDETVNQIARRYGLNARDIVDLNVQRVDGLRPGAILYEGTVLMLPRGGASARGPHDAKEAQARHARLPSSHAAALAGRGGVVSTRGAGAGAAGAVALPRRHP